jgi:multidrug resistance efflux pump
VARVQAQPGDVVQAGQEVARIVSENSTRVIGFLPEVFLGSVKKGDQAVIWRERDGKSFVASVESIAPDVRTLPGRITPMKAQTMRGRRVVLKISDPADLTPGETVRIKPHTQPFSYIRKLFQSHSAK